MTELAILLIFLILLAERILFQYKNDKVKEQLTNELEKSLLNIKTLSFKPLGNYENDIKFLDKVIEDELHLVIVYRLKPMKIAGYNVNNDELFEKLREETVNTVYKKLSENYINNLKLYFSEEGLLEYIVEKVNIELLDVMLNNAFNLRSQAKK